MPAARKSPKRSRNRAQTEARIQRALETILAERGFDGLGVNSVAEASGVSKELIYRYFGGLDGLVVAWMEERDYWSSRRPDAVADRMKTGADVRMLLRSNLKDFLEELRSSPHLQEIRRWEIASRTPLAAQIAARREQAGRRLVAALPSEGEQDNAALYTILTAALCYLVLRSVASETYFGISLRTDQGWKRLFAAIDRILSALFPSTAPAGKPKPKPAARKRRTRAAGRPRKESPAGPGQP